MIGNKIINFSTKKRKKEKKKKSYFISPLKEMNE